MKFRRVGKDLLVFVFFKERNFDLKYKMYVLLLRIENMVILF